MKNKFILLIAALFALAMPLQAVDVVQPLPTSTAAAFFGATVKVTVRASDIANATNAATQGVVTNQIYPVTGLFGSNTVVGLVFADLVIPFSGNTGDTNMNTNMQIWLGDRLLTNRFGLGGANVATNAGIGAGSPRLSVWATNSIVAYTNANALNLITSTYLATNVVGTNVTAGQLDLYFRVFDRTGLRGN